MDNHLADKLIREKVLTYEQLKEAVALQKRRGGSLEDALVELGFVTEFQVAAFLGEKYGVPPADVEGASVSAEVLAKIPRKVADEHLVVPLSLEGMELCVAMADPMNLVAVDDVGFVSGCNVVVKVASERAIRKAIERWYGGGTEEGGSAEEAEVSEVADGEVATEPSGGGGPAEEAEGVAVAAEEGAPEGAAGSAHEASGQGLKKEEHAGPYSGSRGEAAGPSGERRDGGLEAAEQAAVAERGRARVDGDAEVMESAALGRDGAAASVPPDAGHAGDEVAAETEVEGEARAVENGAVGDEYVIVPEEEWAEEDLKELEAMLERRGGEEAEVGPEPEARETAPVGEEAEEGVEEAATSPSAPFDLGEEVVEPAHRVESGAKTVLVIDDSPTVQAVSTVLLGRRGFNVVVAADALQGLAKMEETTPDLVFVNVELPRVDGYQFCKIVRSREETRDVPVVMLASSEGLFDKVKGKIAGATDFLVKPLRPTAMTEAALRLLGPGGV